jgi:hypothetical protein
MSTRLIRQSEVRKLAKEKGKKVGTSFLAWLDREVMNKVQNSIHSLGGKTILNAEDAEAYDKRASLIPKSPAGRGLIR